MDRSKVFNLHSREQTHQSRRHPNYTLMSSGDTHWFAIRVFYNHIYRIKEELEKKGVQTYMAVKSAPAASPAAAAGKPRRRPTQLAPSLLFLRWDAEHLAAFKQDHFSELMVYRRADSTEPAPIDDREMEMFILVTSALGGREVEYAGQTFDFKPGERVRVTEGPFKGAEGVIKRIKKDRKLLVSINGIVVVAVSNIPAPFLERIND